MAHGDDIDLDIDPADVLATLLRRADAAAGPAPHVADLAGRVRRRRDRRRRVRRAAMTLATLVLVAGLWRIAGPNPVAPAAPPMPDELAVADSSARSRTAPGPRGGEAGSGRPGIRVAVGPAVPATDRAEVRRRLDGLARECELREQAVRLALAAGEQRRAGASSRRARTSRRVDPLLELQWQREQAALVLVRQGDRLAGELSLPKSAALAYRSASDTFPGTHWGAVARARLTGANEGIP